MVEVLAKFGNNGEICSGQGVFYIVLHLSLKLVLKSVHTINPEALFSKSMNEIRLSGYMSSKKDFLRGPK